MYAIRSYYENELLLEARKIREQTLRYSLAMILLSIPLTYLLARKISRPIQLLANETVITSYSIHYTKLYDKQLKEKWIIIDYKDTSLCAGHNRRNRPSVKLSGS